MYRLRIWGFTALVVIAGLCGAWWITRRAAPVAMEEVTATLRGGALQFENGMKLLSSQVREVAGVAARSPGFGRPGADPVGSVEQALRSAAESLQVDLGPAPLVGVSFEQSISLRIGGKRFAADAAVVRSLLGTGSPPAHVRIDDTIYAVSVASGEKGLVVVLGIPVDARWSSRYRELTGTDLSLVGVKPISTLGDAEIEIVVPAALRANGQIADAGSLGPVRALGVPLALPILFFDAPAWRVRALSLPGIDGPVAVVSASALQALDPIAALQQGTLLALLLLGIAGFALGFGSDQAVPPHVPRELASASDRIAQGDFTTRVPRMSGTFGTVAMALSRATEAARQVRTEATQSRSLPMPEPLPPPPSLISGPPPEPTPPARPLQPVAPLTTLELPLHALAPGEFTASQPLTDEYGGYAATGGYGLAPPPTPPPVALREPGAVPASPRPAAPPRPPPAPPPDEALEASWRKVHEEYLRVRTEHGESLDGITWERFREKLRKNRDQLIQKYACRAVRFQVYVKAGKAALRATPVR